MQWGEPRPRHIRDPKARVQEDTLQVKHLSEGQTDTTSYSETFIFQNKTPDGAENG